MSGDQPNNESTPPDDLTNIDLYCLHCGYNLRGLSGDPRRCPECGKLSPLTPSEDMIARELHKMETWPTACVGASALLLGSLVFPALACWGFILVTHAFACCLLALAISFPVWFGAMEQFASDCMYKPGWKVVLAQYHLYGVILCLFLAAAVGLCFWLLWRLLRSHDEFIGLIGLAALLTAGALVLPLARRIRRQCAARMKVLQHEVAATRAKVNLHGRLSRPRR